MEEKQMNLEYLARHISKELHTFVRIYTPFSGTYRLEYSCCGRPDFLDREVLNTSLLQVLLDLGTQTCPPLVLINGSFSYVAGSVENRRFLLGPFRLASQMPAKYTQEVPPVSGAWLSSLSICSLSVLSANVLLLYNLFTAVPLTEEEWIAENCPQEYTNFELEENFSRQVFSNREMQIRHNPYDQELREFGSIEKGDVEGLMKSWEEDYPGVLGTLAEDPVRSAKNIAIVVITLASRVAMRGGVIPETAYSLSDTYIQKLEKLSDIVNITRLMHDCELRYTKSVKELKAAQEGNIDQNPYLRQCKDYIFSHLHEKIRIRKIAEELEVNPSYLSQCFKSWEGISMKQFILREKIRLCKNMLTYSPYSYSAIAAYLGFSSQSHLGKLFKKETGMTLGDYRLKYGVKKLWGAEGRW